MLPRKNLFLLLISLLLINEGDAFAAKLSLPVELSIENGDFKDCIVHVAKNGTEILATPGKTILHISLDFNNDFLRTFLQRDKFFLLAQGKVFAVLALNTLKIAV